MVFIHRRGSGIINGVVVVMLVVVGVVVVGFVVVGFVVVNSKG